MKNRIEKCYIDENGQPKVIMNQNTAEKVRTAIEFFEKAIAKSNFSEVSQTRLTAKAIAEKFMPEGTVIGEYKMFLDAVKEKANELLGIEEK